MPKAVVGFFLLLTFHFLLPIAQASELSETLNDTAQVIEAAASHPSGKLSEIETLSGTGLSVKGTTGCRDSLGDLFRER